jgi:transcriptional regulator with XRE-family HTH domain
MMTLQAVVESATRRCAFAPDVVKYPGNEGFLGMNREEAVELGRFLRARRVRLGLSTRAVGAKCGTDKANIIRLEQGKVHSPRPEKLEALALALELPVGDVFARAGYPTADLPPMRAYLRDRYGKLPTGALDEIEAYFDDIAARYGVDPNGPQPGEDEHPEDA